MICIDFTCLNCFNSFSRYCASLAYTERRYQKIADLPVLATCWSGTLAMLSSEVNGHADYEGTTDMAYRDH